MAAVATPVRRALCAGFALLVAVAVPVAAAPAPQAFFLVDAAGDPAAVMDGSLQLYDPVHPNVPNATAPQTREVFVQADAVRPVQFLTDAGLQHPSHIKGQPIILIWTGPSPMVHGNLTVTLYAVGAETTELAHYTVNMDANFTKVPTNATRLVPPTPAPPPTPDPNHPEVFEGWAIAAAAGALFYELAQFEPAVLQPPIGAYLPMLDVDVPADARIAVGFRVDPAPGEVTVRPPPSPSPLPPIPPVVGPESPEPVGAFVQLQYNAGLMPSLIVIPWATPDPIPTNTGGGGGGGLGSYTYTSGGSTGTFCYGGCGSSSSATSDDKAAPFLPMAAFAALAVAVAAARRRLP